jgi:hypothetical protein
LITGYVCRRCGALNLLDAEFEYASYREGDRIVAEITSIHPVGPDNAEATTTLKAVRIVTSILAGRGAPVRRIAAKISRELEVDRDTAFEILLEIVVELGDQATLSRKRDGLWLGGSIENGPEAIRDPELE